MFKKVFVVASLLMSLLTACSAAAPKNVAPMQEDEKYAGIPAAQPSTVMVKEGQSGNQAEPKRIVIKNASLSIVVDDPAKSSERIGKMADEMGGFVVSAEVYQTSNEAGASVLHATLTIRVPAEKLGEALSRIKAESSQPVIRETLSSEDVTAAYTDLQSRLRNAEAAEAELIKVLDSAQKTEDVLNIYDKLKAVREEIEVLKGQIQYYDQAAALSAISVDLSANAAMQPISVGGWQPEGTAKKAIQALIKALQWLGNAAIWLLLFCAPILLIIGLPVALVVRIVRRQTRKARQAMKVTTATPTPPAESPGAER